MLTTTTILLAAGTMLGLAVLFGWLLGWANERLAVEVDPRVEAILGVLPGANCGGCGYVGCGDYAEAVVGRGEAVNRCTVGGSSCAEAVAAIMGVAVEQTWPYRPVVHCGAHTEHRRQRAPYVGVATCAAANLVAQHQGCAYGCLGLGDCVRACDHDAIHIVDGLATVDYVRCVGCGACERACPRHIISMVPFKSERMLVVTCSNLDFGNDVREVCDVGCIGCKQCERTCPLFAMVDNLARIDYEQYDPTTLPDSLATALEKCPRESLVYVGRPTAEDLAAVAGEELPERITADFDTTVDDTEWRG